jgi:hypothetical protein
MTVTDELPRRPRRKLATPLTGALAAVLIAALGFIGGVKVQKSSADSMSGGVSPGRAAGGFTAPNGGGGAAAGDATVGTVANVDGKSIYVTDSSGNTTRVKMRSSSKVTRTAVSKVGDVHPGDTVIVQGQASSGGTVTATSVTATAKNATGGIAGLFGGGAGRAGGGQPTQEGDGG